MARKLIHTATAGKHSAKVYRDSDWNEYRTRFYVDGVLNADAFTNDKSDALTSAQAVIDRMHAADMKPAPVATVPVFTDAPALDHDELMATRYQSHLNQRMRNERRIVWNLFQVIAADGFTVCEVDDMDELTEVKTLKDAMELCFNLDDVFVNFKKDKQIQWVRFIFGNGNDGKDVLCDYTVGLTCIEAFDFDACVAAWVAK